MIRFDLLRFHSPLITQSLLLSFPAPTGMLSFGAFPSFKVITLRIHVLFGHMAESD